MSLVTITSTTTTSTMQPSSTDPKTRLASTLDHIPSPDLATATDSFTPGQCLFCPSFSPTFGHSVTHMQRVHGLFVPYQQHLAVDVETLFRYLHLVIFGYRECISCGKQRTSVQAVQQHMTGKGHCRFDISERGSEFADFFDSFDSSGDDETHGIESDTDGEERSERQGPKSSRQRSSLVVDDNSLRLPSGKIISRRRPVQPPHVPGAQSEYRRKARRVPHAQLEHSVAGHDDAEPSEEQVSSDGRDTQLLPRRREREKPLAIYQLANMRASNRMALMHLPPSEQRAILATQYRQELKVQKEDARRQRKIDRKGNKNLYAYWNTETPVYQCG